MTPPFDYDKARDLQMRADQQPSDPFPDRISSGDELDRAVVDVVVGGAETAVRLKKAGISTVKDLLARCATPEDRVAVANETGIAETHLFEWASSAELLRISGITPEFAAMLEAVGAGTLITLRDRKADRIADAMLALTSERSMTLLVPSAAVVDGWIRHAERLTPVVIATNAPDPSPRQE